MKNYQLALAAALAGVLAACGAESGSTEIDLGTSRNAIDSTWISFDQTCGTETCVHFDSTGDTLVPASYQQRIIDAYAGPRTVLDFRDAEHNTPLDEPIEGEIRAAIARLGGAGADETAPFGVEPPPGIP